MSTPMIKTLVATFVTASCALGAAQAQNEEAEFFDIGFGGAAYVSTMGVGGQGIVTLNDYLSLGGGFDAGAFDLNFEADFEGIVGVENGKASLSAWAPHVMLGVHPFSNDIRLGAGLAYADLKAVGKFSYDGASYDGDFEFEISNEQKFAPVLTAGFAHSTRGGLGIYTEVGAMFSGDMTYTSTATNNCSGALATACNAERLATKKLLDEPIEAALGFYPGFYPIARFGLRISF